MYKAKIITANSVVKHEGANRLQVLSYNGVRFVVGMDITSGDLVCLFPAG